MHTWVLTTKNASVLLEDKETSDINRNGKCLLQFCANDELHNDTFFAHKGFKNTLGTEIRWDSILLLIFVLLTTLVFFDSQCSCKEELNYLSTIT